MKIKDLGDLIVFDTFPLLYEPKQKVIITNLLHLEDQIFPSQLPMIFTTQKLAEQLKKYLIINKLKCLNKGNVVIVKPYEFIDIVLERRRTLQMLFCASEEEESNNVMVLIKENGQLAYIYAGNFVDIRSAVLNDAFASWVTHGVEKLYVNLKRIEENHIFNEIELIDRVFNKIEEIKNCHRNSATHIRLPLFGYEHFILKLAERFPKRIKLSNLNEFYINYQEDDPVITANFCKAAENDEKIILHSTPLNTHEANMVFKKTKEITINIINDKTKCSDYEIATNNGYYELFYSPEPSPFQLKLLTMLVKPKRIFGIVDTFNNKSKVPQYLYELCVGAKENIMKKHDMKLSNALFAVENTQHDNQAPRTIIAGAFPNRFKSKSGPYLSDSESDDDL